MDGSKPSVRGLDKAIEIARGTHATIAGVYIIPILPTNLPDAMIPYYLYPITKAKRFMTSAKKRAAKKGIVFRSKIIHGSPIREIQDMAKSKKFDLIVIGSRGQGKLKEVFLGSVANAVVHRSPIPVLVVK